MDKGHLDNKGRETNMEEYKKSLKEIGYPKEEGSESKMETNKVDEEISQMAGPQLVVPIRKARNTGKAAKARGVSQNDSLNGTEIIESEEGGSERNDPNRGQEVIK
jgi:hypothetical protein